MSTDWNAAWSVGREGVVDIPKRPNHAAAKTRSLKRFSGINGSTRELCQRPSHVFALAGANGDATIARISAQAARAAAMAAVEQGNAGFPARQRQLQLLGA